MEEWIWILISRENHVIAVRGINSCKRQVGSETGNVVTSAELNVNPATVGLHQRPRIALINRPWRHWPYHNHSVHSRPPTYPYYGLPFPMSVCYFTPTVCPTRTSNPHGRLEHAGGELVGLRNLQDG